MDKAIGAVVAVVAILALALGAVCGVAWGLSKAWQSPAMVAALARQESARADTLQAQADKERAAADAAGAWSRSSSLLAIEWSRRWPLAPSFWVALFSVWPRRPCFGCLDWRAG